MLKFLLPIILVAFTASAADPVACNDDGKVYKVCGNQQALFDARVAEAKASKKMVVAVIGAEWCPWCMALHKSLGTKDFEKYVLADVGVYNGKVLVPSGTAIFEQLRDAAGSKMTVKEGIPILAVLNPENGKARLINTEPLEHNTKTTKGHNKKKVLAALAKASREVR